MDAFDFELRQAQGQRSETWIQDRLGKFTASEIHRLCAPVYEEREMTADELSARPKKGKGSKTTTVKVLSDQLSDGAISYCWEKIAERLTGLPASNEFVSDAIMRGIEMEPLLKKAYCHRYDCAIMDSIFIPFTQCAGCSPDGLVGDIGLIEGKCPDSDTHLKYMQIKDYRELPTQYRWQVQSQLLFTGRDWCDFVSYDDRFKDPKLHLFVLHVVPNEEDHAWLTNRLQKAETFVQTMINQLTA